MRLWETQIFQCSRAFCMEHRRTNFRQQNDDYLHTLTLIRWIYFRILGKPLLDLAAADTESYYQTAFHFEKLLTAKVPSC